jgi:hypothetical protein
MAFINSFGDFAELMAGIAALGCASWLFERVTRSLWKGGRTSEQRPRSETHDEKVDRVRAMIGDVLPALGQIMEQSPLVIFPTAKLPLPKDEMKIALQLAWGMTTDKRMRGFAEAGYMHLANFRTDIERPIDPTIASTMTPAQTVSTLDPYLAVSKGVLAETHELMKEFEEFKRLSASSKG